MIALSLAGVVALATLVMLVTGFIAYRESQALADSLRTMQQQAREAQFADVAAELSSAQQSAHRLRQATWGPLWSGAEHIPGLGASVQAARSLAVASDELLTSALPLSAPLTEASTGGFRAAGGGINLALLQQVTAQLPAVIKAAEVAQLELADIDPASLPAALASPVTTAQRDLPRVVSTATSLNEAAERIPGLLGASAPRTWALLLQNPAEARGTGGIVGGYALINVDNGRASLAEVGANDQLLPIQPIDTSVVGEDVRNLLGSDLAEWASINLSPDFPTAAKLARQGFAQRNNEVDGIVAIDPYFVAAVLRMVGPVTYDGITLTPDNAVDYITRQVYFDQADSNAKDRVLVGLLGEVVRALFTKPLITSELPGALQQMSANRHVQVWSANVDEQEWLASTAVGGVLSTEPGPILTVALSNGAGNKIDSFVNTTIDFAPSDCIDGDPEPSVFTLTFTNVAPEQLPGYIEVRNDGSTELGGERMLVAVYSAPDALLIDSTLNGKPASVTTLSEQDRTVWLLDVEVPRGATSSVVMKFSQIPVAGVEPAVNVQPMAVPAQVTVRPVATCSVPPSS